MTVLVFLSILRRKASLDRSCKLGMNDDESIDRELDRNLLLLLLLYQPHPTGGG